jgi:hypothetical protein
VIGISLTFTLEESKERGVETRDTRSREMILAVGARGHVAKDQCTTKGPFQSFADREIQRKEVL